MLLNVLDLHSRPRVRETWLKSETVNKHVESKHVRTKEFANFQIETAMNEMGLLASTPSSSFINI